MRPRLSISSLDLIARGSGVGQVHLHYLGFHRQVAHHGVLSLYRVSPTVDPDLVN